MVVIHNGAEIARLYRSNTNQRLGRNLGEALAGPIR